MKIGYFDCIGGASGDMILGSLIDAGLSKTALKKELAALPLIDWQLATSNVKKGQIIATQAVVKSRHHGRLRKLKDIHRLLDASSLPPTDIRTIKKIFRRLARAEARIHAKKIHDIQFHEVGAVDSIIDVVGTICGLRLMDISQVIVSSFPLGRGLIHTSHGSLPLPAPATVELLKNFSVYGIEEVGETVTPTAAAILSTLVSSPKLIPAGKIESVGYGAGTANFKSRPNLLRLIVFEEEKTGDNMELLTLLETNIDDVNPQVYDFVAERLFNAGALDVWLTPIQMKKNRPAVTLSILCQISAENKIMAILFQEGLTLGIRRRPVERISLTRQVKTVNTKFGKIRVKIAGYNQKIVRVTPEYDDCKKIAQKTGIPIGEVILTTLTVPQA